MNLFICYKKINEIGLYNGMLYILLLLLKKIIIWKVNNKDVIYIISIIKENNLEGK